MIKLKQFFWGDVEIELHETRGTKTPPRVVYGYIFTDMDEQHDRANELRRNHYHDVPLIQQGVYIHESDIVEIEPFDIEREPLIISDYGKATTDPKPS